MDRTLNPSRVWEVIPPGAEFIPVGRVTMTWAEAHTVFRTRIAKACPPSQVTTDGFVLYPFLVVKLPEGSAPAKAVWEFVVAVGLN